MAAKTPKNVPGSKRPPKNVPAGRIANPAPVSRFAKSLLNEWRSLDLPATGARVVIGVSGGADSVALLLAIDELIRARKLMIKLTVAHVNHQLRDQSAADARWVRELADRFGHDVQIKGIDVRALARKKRDNLEQAARRARYAAFAAIAQKSRARFVLTAHTMNDQAETVLMNLLRGSGSDGLAGISPVRALNQEMKAVLARPLLSWAQREDTERFCVMREVEYRQDKMNTDESFSRVRARRRLLPLMQSFNPRLVEGLVRTAALLRDDAAALESAAERLLELSRDEAGETLHTDLLAEARPALRRRALRRWMSEERGDLRRLELVHIRAVEGLLNGAHGGRTIELPGGATVRRRGGQLIFKPKTRTRKKTKT
jgi:tRNA(Ile)-lysidine synthase